MSKIDKQAELYSTISQLKSDYPHDKRSSCDGFKAGVEFAQQWIDATIQLPEKDVLVLCKICRLAYTDHIYAVGYLRDIEQTVWKIEGHNITHHPQAINNCVTHWRLIDII